ncbi:MAG TPA: ABC transporter permease [Chloroflexota bacterium]|nr:ABC transporter permease [Chloroflexota bacterium]
MSDVSVRSERGGEIMSRAALGARGGLSAHDLAPAGATGGAASLPRMLAAQTWAEVLLSLRRGESVLVTLVIPVVLLAFFMSVGALPVPIAHPIDFLLPGTLALAVIATGLANLGIATAYERGDGVLKRLGATPLPRAGLVLAKLLSVVILEVVQVVVLVGLAIVAYGWRPQGEPALALLALLLGTAAFAGLGLLMAGTLRPEATLAGANGLFLVLLLLGGLFLPLSALPAWMAAIGHLLPAAALADTLRGALAQPADVPPGSALLLLAWSVAAPLAAALTFHWE